MVGMPVYSDEAVVLRTRKLAEADRIITLLTREHGVVRAVAKGVRRTSSKFGSRLEPFTHVDLQLYEGRNLDTITQAVTKSPYGAAIGSDYERYTAASVMLETAERLVVEERQPPSSSTCSWWAPCERWRLVSISRVTSFPRSCCGPWRSPATPPRSMAVRDAEWSGRTRSSIPPRAGSCAATVVCPDRRVRPTTRSGTSVPCSPESGRSSTRPTTGTAARLVGSSPPTSPGTSSGAFGHCLSPSER